MEKIYKTMQGTGVINIVIGSVIITVGLAAGVMAIVSGAFLHETQIRYYILKIGFETGQICPVERENRMTGDGVRFFSFLAVLCGEFMWKWTKTHQKVCWIFFVAYLVLLIYFMFFSDGFGRAPHVEYAYNLVLFKEIKRFYIYRDIVGTEAFLLNTAGNVVCFMPFGFFLPIISPRFGKWYLMLILSFLLTLSIETIQLVFKVGSFDVDDMFLNTLGGIAGYLCQWITRAIGRCLHGTSNR